MNKIFSLLVAVLLMSSSLFSQKFGYFNSLEVLALVPEVKAADSDLQAFTKVLQAQGESRAKDLQQRAAALEDKKAKGVIAPKQFEDEYALLEKESASLQQLEQEMSQKVAEKRESLYKPILDNVNNKIKEVAKENGYLMIFDTSTGVLLHADETLDVTKLVKAKLNIVE
jgi:outer membrane protein